MKRKNWLLLGILGLVALVVYGRKKEDVQTELEDKESNDKETDPLKMDINKKRFSFKTTSLDNLLGFTEKWVGINETGANKSFADKVFEDMLKKVGWISGQAWCMYFAKAVHWESFPKDRANIQKILRGGTQKSFNNAKNDKTGTYTVITSGQPKLGDIAIWQNLKKPSEGHAGIVIKSFGDSFETVEGNTNKEGSREGTSVLKKIRPLNYGKTPSKSGLKLLGFIRKVNA
jgi:hypothetical protein